MWFLRFEWAAAPSLARILAPGMALYRSEDCTEGCAYLDHEPPPWPIDRGTALVRLRTLRVLPGAASGRDAPWHYVVATDVAAGHDEDFNAWYDNEHLPGLAAVPATVRAARHRVVDGIGPLYHAAYDLADRSALDSPEWLAVRATPWSSRVRPHFLNTRRTMYRRACPGEAA